LSSHEAEYRAAAIAAC
jgi:hypothetical protein